MVEPYKYKDLINGKVQALFCNKSCLQKWQSKKYKNQLVNKKCEYCQNEFKVRKCLSDKKRFCSKDCANKSRRQDIEVKCDYCGTLFTKKKSQIRKNNFCCVECRSKWNSENKNIQIEIKCIVCGKIFKVQRNREKNAKACSRKCLNVWKSQVVLNDINIRNQYIIRGAKTCLK